MINKKERLEIVEHPQDQATASELKVAPRPGKRDYADPKSSNKKGLLGLVETFLRRFQIISHLLLMLPVYSLACLALGIAVAPAIAFFDFASSFAHDQASIARYLILGVATVASYCIYGFSLVFVAPAFNFVLVKRLNPWRGAYYSLEAIRWYIHNGATYIARFTFLEFITPTPMNLLFYRMMGMEIGRGSILNTTYISDPSLISIGEKVTIGGSVTLIGHYGQGGFLVLAKTQIGNRVTIGLKATIMGDVIIGDNAKVLPNSVVMPKTVIPAGEIWGGVPAKKISD
jgi:acetyltransferase-like isoleucine patch superfamily enzyme